jgi:hypothetical protein
MLNVAKVGASFLFVIVLSFSCSSTKLTDVWKDAFFEGEHLESVMVVGVSDNLRTRKIFEDEFVKRFEANGVRAVSSAALSPDQDLRAKAIKAAAVEQGLEAVFVTHLAGVEQKQVYRQGPPRTYPAHYGFFGSYYPQVYGYTHTPGYYTQHELVKLETNLYDVGSEKLIWSAASETFDPDATKKFIESFADVIMKSLRDYGLLR